MYVHTSSRFQRTPLPQIQRLIMSLYYNTNVKALSLANTGLTDTAAEVGCSDGNFEIVKLSK